MSPDGPIDACHCPFLSELRMVRRHHGRRRAAVNVPCAHLGTSFNTLGHYPKRRGCDAPRSTAVGDAALACPDLLPSAWPLLDLGCLRPDGLPQTLMLFVNIGVPVVARWNGVPTDDDFDAGDIANRHRPTIEMDGNLAVWLEDEVVGLTRCNVFEVLRFRRRSPEGVDKLEVVGMQLLGDDHVRLD